MFLMLSPHSISLLSDGTDFISQTVLKDNVCISGEMLWQAEFLRSHYLPEGWYCAVSNIVGNFDSFALRFKEKTESWSTVASQ